MDGIWAIILAAGESKRMGLPKMLLPFNGSTMIETVIRNVRSSNVNNLLVVTGAERGKIEELTDNLSVASCYNDGYKTGMLSSVKCGISNLPSDFDAVLIFQGDQPLISPHTINKIIEAYLLTLKGIVIPVFENKRGHPVLINRKYKAEIEKIDPEKGLRSLAYQFPDDVLEIPTDDPGILRDFDTYEEYKKETNQIL